MSDFEVRALGLAAPLGLIGLKKEAPGGIFAIVIEK